LFLFVSIRFLFGAGEAVVYPASNQFVSRWIPTQERGIANAGFLPESAPAPVSRRL
jgi:ACS family glucarate transporter-like MFS transporter